MKIKTLDYPYISLIHFNDHSLHYRWNNSSEMMFFIACMASIEIDEEEHYSLDGCSGKLMPWMQHETVESFLEYGIESGIWFQNISTKEHLTWRREYYKSTDYYCSVEYQRVQQSVGLEVLDFRDDIHDIQLWFHMLMNSEPQRVYHYFGLLEHYNLEDWIQHIHTYIREPWFHMYFDMPETYHQVNHVHDEITIHCE